MIIFPIQFLESLDNIQFNEDDPTHHDHHQQGHDDQEYTPEVQRGTERFFITTFPKLSS